MGFNKNYLPIFIGPGKEINFINKKNSKTVLDRSLKILYQFPLIKDVILCFGEPDARYAVDFDFKIRSDETSKNLEKNYHQINKSLKN